VEDLKYKPDFGIVGDPWTVDQDQALLKCSLTTYRDEILGKEKTITDSKKVITEKNCEIGEKSDSERRKGGIETRTSALLDSNPQFGRVIPYMNKKDPLNNHNLFAVKEFIQIDEVQHLEFPANKYEKDLQDLLTQIKSKYKEDHIKSVISILPSGENWLYTYPSDINADYAEIFWQVFCIRKKWQGKKAVFSWGLDDNKKNPQERLQAIPIDKYFIRSAGFYLLDFLLAQTACFIEEQEPDQSVLPLNEGQNKLCKIVDEISGRLDKFKSESGYSNSKTSDIKNAFNNKLKVCSYIRRDRQKDSDKEYIKEIDTAFKELHALLDVKNGVFTIPEYRIVMPSIFEIYVYSLLYGQDEALQYQPRIETKSGTRIPDIVDMNRKIAFDLKYRFNFQLEDGSEQIRNYREIFNQVVFIYPRLQESIDDRNLIRILECKEETAIIPIVFPRNSFKWRQHITKWDKQEEERKYNDNMYYEEDDFIATID